MKLSIIIPVFNEERTVGKILKKVIDVKLKDIQKEIIVVNDGSTDASASQISKFQILNSKFILINHKNNLGKGAAVCAGLKKATGDYIIIQDADLEYDPQNYKEMLTPILQGRAKVVYGTRLKRMPNFSRDERTVRFLVHYLGNKFLSLVTSILYGQWITDMETCYKLFPRRAAAGLDLNAKGFEFEPEITAKLLRNGFRIFEVPISTNPRGYDEGKKINTFKDGIKALWTCFKYRFYE